MTSGNYFSLVGVDVALGRGFLAEEDQVPGRNPVLRRRRFGADRNGVGRTVILNIPQLYGGGRSAAGLSWHVPRD
jgi:hypothetical protein